jgi:drug/metabolite transporter (DMT)-like permease
VIDHLDRPDTVFGVFATRARRRSARSLTGQAVACAVAGLLLVAVSPSWWPVAAALGAAASYASWGVLDRRTASRIARFMLSGIAAVATLLAIFAAIGVGLAAFTGEGRSPYGMCYDASGRAFSCDARGQRRS